MQALHINWQAGPRHVTLLGVALAAAGLLCTAWVALDYQQADAEWQSLLARQSRQTRASPPSKSRGITVAPLAREDAQSASQLDAQLQRPWDALLHTIEETSVKDVALISLDVQTASSSVHMVGDAKDMEHAQAYVKKLRQAPALKKVYLTSQEEQRSGTQKLLRFSLDASWSDSP